MQAPLCFVAPRLFELWSRADLGLPEKSRCNNPCRDCQPGYQTRMKHQGRCAHPETMFSIDDERGVYGYWPGES
jgi:hypothetical protein